MPIYEYKCATCGKIVETIQKISDPPLEKDESCETGNCNLSKIVSQTSFVLKGEGWYETDFKGTKKKPTKEAESSKKGEEKFEKTEKSSETTSSPSTSEQKSSNEASKSSTSASSEKK